MLSWMKDIDTTILVALIMGIPSIILILSQSRQRKVSVSKDVGETYKQLLEALKQEIERLSSRIDIMEKEKEQENQRTADLENLVENLNTILKEHIKSNADLRSGVVILREQIIEKKEVPKYDLPPELSFEVIEGKNGQ